jgi:topoisomerase-4 subunit A
LKFKDGIEPQFIFMQETTDRLLVFGSNGQFYTFPHQFAGGRGVREPQADRRSAKQVDCCDVYPPAGPQLLVASMLAMDLWCQRMKWCRRSGKQVLNVRGETALVCKPVVATAWRWLARTAKCWSLALMVPEMSRESRGVRLQKYKDGGLSDATT